MFNAPTKMAPAASRRSIKVASRVAGFASRLIFDPASVASPATSNKFFTANGTPARGREGSPRASASSIACARTRARCSVVAVNELSSGSHDRMRASVASTMLNALVRPVSTAAAISPAAFQVKSRAVVSSTEHRRRLDVVWKRKLIDQRRVCKDHVQVALYTLAPRGGDPERKRLRIGSDQRVDEIGRFRPDTHAAFALRLSHAFFAVGRLGGRTTASRVLRPPLFLLSAYFFW